MMINKDWLVAGIDIPIVEYELIMHNPSLREILAFSEQNFMIALQFLTLDKQEVITSESLDLSKASDFQILMQILNTDTEDKTYIIKQVLGMLFPEHKFHITPRSLIIQNDQQLVNIDKDNFYILKTILKEVFILSVIEGSSSSYRPANEKAREIAKKLQQAKQSQAMLKEHKGMGILARSVSIVSVGLQMNYEDLLDLTMFQFFDLFKRMILKVEWDLYIQQLLVGGKPDEVDNWLDKDLYL